MYIIANIFQEINSIDKIIVAIDTLEIFFSTAISDDAFIKLIIKLNENKKSVVIKNANIILLS